MSTVRDKMSCTVMYQPYAMSAYSTCDRPPPEKKSFRFPYVPSPPDSLHSDGSSYSSPGPSSGGTTASNSANNPNGSVNSRRPITPCLSGGGIPGGIITPSPGAGSSAPATITSATQQQRSPPPPLHPPLLGILPHVSTARHTHPHHNHHPHHHHPTGSSTSSSLGIGNNQNSSGASSSSTSTSILVSSSNASSTSTSHTQVHDQHEEAEDSSPDTENHHPITSMHQSGSGGPGNSRAQYLSANCVVYENYRGDTDRIVEEHFTRALSASYANEKGSKCSPMTSRNFPPSFWNSNYQPSKPIMSYGPSDFYGAAVDYGPSLTGLSHHAQADPWHYPLTSHQSYHHRPSDLPYPPMPSSSRFNAAQYGSFLLAGAAASSSTSRFHGMGSSSQCGVKGDTPTAWPSGRYHHPHHESISELHLDYNYSAAAAAAYSNMTAGLETTVGQESSKGDAAYWF